MAGGTWCAGRLLHAALKSVDHSGLVEGQADAAARRAGRRAALENFTEGVGRSQDAGLGPHGRIRRRYCHLLQCRPHHPGLLEVPPLHFRGFIKGYYRVTANQLHLELEILLELQGMSEFFATPLCLINARMLGPRVANG